MKPLYKNTHLTLSGMIYFPPGVKIFSTSDSSANVPNTIEADPEVVNLYLVIVNRDDNGVQNYEIRNISSPNNEFDLKEEIAKVIATDYNSPDSRQQQPDFQYQPAVTEFPQKSELKLSHKETKNVRKKHRRVGRMCKKRGYKAIQCSRIKAWIRAKRNHQKQFNLNSVYGQQTFEDFHVDIPNSNYDINYVLPPPLLLQDSYIDTSFNEPQWVQTNIKEGIVHRPVKGSIKKKCRWPYTLYNESCVIEQKHPLTSKTRQGRKFPAPNTKRPQSSTKRPQKIKVVDNNTKTRNNGLRSGRPTKKPRKNQQKNERTPTIYLRSRFGVKCEDWWPYAWRNSKLCSKKKKKRKGKRVTKGGRHLRKHKRRPYNRQRTSAQNLAIAPTNIITPRVSIEQTISEVIGVQHPSPVDEVFQLDTNNLNYDRNNIEHTHELDDFKPSRFLGAYVENLGNYGKKLLTTTTLRPITETYFTPRRLSLQTVCVGDCQNILTKT